ncbi:MAG TPA: cupin domain-containing protein [Candidatus Dormibacteraeota bacterium]
MPNIGRETGFGELIAAGEGRLVGSGAISLRVKVESAETGGAFALVEVVMQPQLWEGPAPHIHHSGSETFYVIEGTLKMLAGGDVVQATAGTCVHVPAGTVHAFSNPGHGPVRFLQMLAPGSLLTMVEEITSLVAAGIQDRAQIAAIFRRHESEQVPSESWMERSK